MKHVLKGDALEDFTLFTYLAADLRRVQMLLHGAEVDLSGLRLWLGLLSPRFLPVLLCRLAHFFYRLKLGFLAKLFSSLNFFTKCSARRTTSPMRSRSGGRWT